MKKLLALALVALTVVPLFARIAEWEFKDFPDSLIISYRIDDEEHWHDRLGNGIVSASLDGRSIHTLTYRTSASGEQEFVSMWIPELNNEISLSASPYSLSLFTASKGKVISTYALAAGTDYQYRFNDAFGIGAEIRYSLSLLEGDKGVYSSLKAGALFSAKVSVTDRSFMIFALRTGADTVFYAQSPEAFFYLAADAGYGWKLNTNYSLTASLRGDISFITGGATGWQVSPDIRLVCHF